MLWPASLFGAAANRSAYIPTDSAWTGPTAWKWIVLDTAHKQVFTAWYALDRVDVRSTVDYHLIASIALPSPSTVDISQDGTTLAVGTSGAHVEFFSTATLTKTNDIVVPGSGLNISAFVYTANGNAMISASSGEFTSGGGRAYWNHLTNSLTASPNPESPAPTAYLAGGPLGRSGDYSKIMLGDGNGDIQVVDGNSGKILWSASGYSFGDEGDQDPSVYGLAANDNASRYAICTATGLLILDSFFRQIYQDQSGCLGMTFSGDGLSLYRDVQVGSASYTQALDVFTFATKNVANYFTAQTTQSHNSSFWQASDTTGLVYGVYSDYQDGITWIVQDMAATTAPVIPGNGPVKILRVIDNIGSPQGGDTVRLLCSGLNFYITDPPAITIGGAAAKYVTSNALFPGPSLSDLIILTVQTPPGKPGLTDVNVSASAGADTFAKGFQYARSRKIFPFATSPDYLLFDSLRNRLYAAHKDQVEVIDVPAQKLLAPLVPASGKLTNSQFAGLSLSPDQNRLYIADAGANMIHILDLAKPGTGSSINVTQAIGSSSPVTPDRVFELSNGQLLGTNGNLFLVDPKTSKGEWATDSAGNMIPAFAWNSTNQGQKVLLSTANESSFEGAVGFWNANSTQIESPSGNVEAIVEAGANEDGTVIATGGSTEGEQITVPEFFDSNLDPLGSLNEHFDVGMPTGTAGLSLDASGALFYQPGRNGNAGAVEIDDVHHWLPAATIVFPELLAGTYSPFTQHQFTTDAIGRTFFAVTQSGITMMVLDTVPLSIGNIQPAIVQPNESQSVTIRGSGFQPGAIVTFGKTKVVATYVDDNTLTAETPALSPGWSDVKVTLPSGVSYAAAGLLQALGPQTAPVISGFSPQSLNAEFGVPANPPQVTTIVGSGFDAYDSVEVDGQLTASAFIDSSHIQAAVPQSYVSQSGTVPFTVVSPYQGPSNTVSFPIVNPVPRLNVLTPVTVSPGDSTGSLAVDATNCVSNSIIRWNGKDLVTNSITATSAPGICFAEAIVPAGLLEKPGTASITLFNPAPAGGASNALTIKIAADLPVVIYPAKIDFGTVLLKSTGTFTASIQNVGTGTYHLVSGIVSSPAFTTQNSCENIPAYGYCVLNVIFTPAAAGPLSATLTIKDNQPGKPHVVNLTGAGVATLIPMVTVQDVEVLDQTVSATVQGNAVVGGPSVAATAWLEYGTDLTLSTFTKSPSWTFTGQNGFLSEAINGLKPDTEYAVRIVVQTAGGTGKSNICLFATAPAPPEIVISNAKGASGSDTRNAGQTASYAMVASDGGFGYTGIATLSCTGAPPGSACTVTPSQINLGVADVGFEVKVTTTTSTPAGNYLVSVMGTTGAVENSAYLDLTVR